MDKKLQKHHVLYCIWDDFFNYLTDFCKFPLSFSQCKTQSEQVKNEHFGRFQIFFVDILLFYFLTRIIPDLILQSKLADMELRIQSARLLMYKAALLKDADKPFTKVSHYLSLFPLQ